MRHRCSDCGYEFNSYPQHPPNTVKTPQCPVCFKDNCKDIPPNIVQQPLSGSQGSPKSKCKRCGCEIEPTKLELCYSCYESEE